AAELLGKDSMDGRDVDPDLLEDPAAHHRHDAAAAVAAILGRALPGGAHEAAGRAIRQRPGIGVLQPLEGGADPVAQPREPGGRPGPSRRVGRRGAHAAPAAGRPPVWRSASPSTMAAASATLSERIPGRIGTLRRASAAAWTSAGTPALSRPSSSRSSAREAEST